MKVILKKLNLSFQEIQEEVTLAPLTYFYGQMGAGKTSIARLIDYCLGGDLELTPALQQNFVSATLHLEIEDTHLAIERPRDSTNVHASWRESDGSKDLILPARQASGIKIPGTEVEVLSDLIFFIAGKKPPRVRRSKQQEDSALSRLSIREMLWYCYLDQDTIDSTFFHLDPEAPYYKRNKSRDVLRFIIGFHQEVVSDLETQLQEVRERRLQAIGVAQSLKEALTLANVASEEEITNRIHTLERELTEIDVQLQDLRRSTIEAGRNHGIDVLRSRARHLASEIDSVESAVPEIRKMIDNDQRHINELLMLGIKFRRAASARAVLSGVDFELCPRCTQSLPVRDANCCPVCGQEEPVEGTYNLNTDVLENDSRARISELEEAIERHTLQLRNMQSRLREVQQEKFEIDTELNREMEQYDSAYLSSSLVLERRRASIEQGITDLRRLIGLARKVEELYRNAASFESEESEIKRKLREARIAAESNRGNLDRLELLFLDCLARARIPGINHSDVVEIASPSFLPEVKNTHSGDLAVTSFSNLSSGGKKTLFKACFALAIHRLSVEIEAMLPTFVIIDSPMKNISERENRFQFEGFHQLIYELVNSELSETQVILIDKEFCPPPQNFDISSMETRYMTPDNDAYPPLIRTYRGP
jgi:rRNA maturation endonuclease Nob1